MKKGISGFLVLLAVVVVLGGWLASTYNGLVKENELVDGQWAQVESKLQRRHDLIPVSYTHLDVYKRQTFRLKPAHFRQLWPTTWLRFCLGI